MDTNKRFLLALILSFLFVYVYSGIVFRKYAKPQNPIESPQNEGLATEEKEKVSALSLTGDKIEVETEKLKVDIFLQGGIISNVRLKDYKESQDSSNPLTLIDSSKEAGLFAVYDGLKADLSKYQLISDRYIDTYREIHLKSIESGVDKIFQINLNNYYMDVRIEGLIKNHSVVMAGFNGEQETRLNIHRFISLDLDNKIHRDPLNNSLSGLFQGVGFDSLYFSVFGVSKRNPLRVASSYENIPLLIIKPPTDKQSLELRVFLGPKEIRSLEVLGFPFVKILDLGFFAILAEPILKALLWLGNHIHNYGLAIVLLTIIIRLILFPLNSVSYRAMEKLKELQPEIDRLRKEYSNDPQALNRELLLLYQKKRVNPFSGCFPVIFQIPIFFGLYSALLHAVELRQASFFGWIHDLSKTDYVYLGPIPIPLLTLIFGASFIYIQRLNPPQFTDPAQEQVFKWLPYLILIMFIIFPMPSGLILYWLVNNLSSIAQILISKKFKFNKSFLLNLVINLIIAFFAYILSVLF